MLTVLSWNMNQRAGAWQHLRSLVSQFEVSIALLQEARRPTHLPDSWSAYPPTDDALRWQIGVCQGDWGHRELGI